MRGRWLKACRIRGPREQRGSRFALALVLAFCSGRAGEYSGGGVPPGSLVDFETDAANCGTWAHACRLPHAVAACSSGQCEIAGCDHGWEDCNGSPDDGCETDLGTLADCGRCGNACELPHAAATCAGGMCRVSFCEPGWEDCDGQEGNGCETNLGTDVAHCGACRSPVRAGLYCVGGEPSAECPTPLAVCGASCVDTDGDATHCGSCGNACDLPHARAICSSGTCGVDSCSAGFGDCNGDPDDGCETDLTSSVLHCGRCGNTCELPNAVATCASGVCRVRSCEPGWGDCDGVDVNGCEADLSASAENCGECGKVCRLPHAHASCTDGACSVAGCAPGWDHCTSSDLAGCEADIRSDPAHCGGCNKPVPPGQYCVGGTPSPSCPAPLTACGRVCADTASDVSNCGTCGNACVLAHATAECQRGTCTIASCDASWGDCDQDPANGCDTSIGVEPNCGSCGRACPPGYRCTAAPAHASAGCVYWP